MLLSIFLTIFFNLAASQTCQTQANFVRTYKDNFSNYILRGKNFAIDTANSIYYHGSVTPVVYKVDSAGAILLSK